MTRVQPERIVFIGKEQLKKREVRVVTLWPRLAAAASVALLIGVAWWLLRDKPTGAVEVARNVQQLQPAVRVPQGPEPPSLERFGGQRPETLKENVPKTPGESGAHMSTPSMSHDKERNENNGQKPATPQQNVAPGSLLPPPEPQLAHTPAVVQPVPDALVPPNDNEPSLVQQNTPDQEAMKAQEAAGSNVSTLLTNAMRTKVLDVPQRPTGPDESDALALVNKGLGAITGGEGHVQVERTAARKHWQLRLGRNFTVSASAATN